MTVTRETITCRKCRAVGIQNFKRGPVYVEGGLCLDVVSCLICSDWYAHKPAALKMERQVAPVKDRGLATCHVAGCGNYISANPLQNKSGLCTTCSNRMSSWKKAGSPGLAPLIRTATGYMTRAAFAALNPSEVTHVEITQSLPRLASPAPATPAECHSPSRPAQLRRDSDESLSRFIAVLLVKAGLTTPATTIAGWSPGEQSEVVNFLNALQKRKTTRRMPALPDVLVAIYDAAYGEKRSA